MILLRQTLQEINLGSNHVGVEGTRLLADALKVNQVISHDCWSNRSIYFMILLKQTLREINLSSNHVGADGARVLADALKVNQVASYNYSRISKCDR